MEVRKVLRGNGIPFEDRGMQSIDGEPEGKKFSVLILGDVTPLAFFHLYGFITAYPRMDKRNEMYLKYEGGKLVLWYYTLFE